MGVTSIEGWLRICGQAYCFNEMTAGQRMDATYAWNQIVADSPSLPVALFNEDVSVAVNGSPGYMNALLEHVRATFKAAALAAGTDEVDDHVKGPFKLNIPPGFWARATDAELISIFGENAVKSARPQSGIPLAVSAR